MMEQAAASSMAKIPVGHAVQGLLSMGAEKAQQLGGELNRSTG